MFDFDDDDKQPIIGARIKVIGAGGGGGNAINTMIASGLTGVEFIVANTDKQALAVSHAPTRLQIGRRLTSGLGAGGNPDVGKGAAIEDAEAIKRAIEGSDMIFITAGMGGGTGTGAAPIIASIAREMGILTVAVVTKPFFVEGVKRQQKSEQGIEELKKYVDTLIIIPNERLLAIVGQETLEESFKKVDQILLQSVRGVSDLVNKTGQMNLDFADIKAVMKNSKGVAIVGIGSAAGEDRTRKAAKAAITSPLLGNLKINGATGILVNITAATSITLKEIIDAVTYIKECAGIVDPTNSNDDVKIGVVRDETLANEVRMTVVAAGVQSYDFSNKEEEKKKEVIIDTIKVVEQAASIPVPVKEDTSKRAAARKAPEEPPMDDLFKHNDNIGDFIDDTPAFLKKGKKINTESL